MFGLANFSTSGGLLDVIAPIAQGDAYNQRFGNQVIPKRVNLKFGVRPGGSATTQFTCRLTLVRASASLIAGATVDGSLNPIANTSILQVYWDKLFQVAPSVANQYYPTVFNWSIPVKMGKAKFSGAGTNTVVGESIFLLWSSNAASGATAPIWDAGITEFFYTP